MAAKNMAAKNMAATALSAEWPGPTLERPSCGVLRPAPFAVLTLAYRSAEVH